MTATQRAPLANSVTQLQASASAGREPQGVSAQTANQVSGVFPTACPVNVMAMQSSVTPKPESVEAVETTQQDTCANGKQ